MADGTKMVKKKKKVSKPGGKNGRVPGNRETNDSLIYPVGLETLFTSWPVKEREGDLEW